MHIVCNRCGGKGGLISTTPIQSAFTAAGSPAAQTAYDLAVVPMFAVGDPSWALRLNQIGSSAFQDQLGDFMCRVGAVNTLHGAPDGLRKGKIGQNAAHGIDDLLGLLC